MDAFINNIELLNQLPGWICIKSLDSIFIQGNNNFIDLVGAKNRDWLIGRTDHDIPCKASEFAESFIEEDKAVLQSQQEVKSLHVYPFSPGLTIGLSIRKLLYDSIGTPSAILLQSLPVNSVLIQKIISSSIKINSSLVGHGHCIGTFKLDADCESLLLSQRELECLFFLIRGYSAKAIGQVLNISPRTVERHIDNMKMKLACNNKAQLIEKAYEIGYASIIPSKLLDNSIVKKIYS